MTSARRHCCAQASQVLRLSNLAKVAVAAEAVLEAARARDAVLDQCFAPVVPFLDERLAHGQPVTPDRGASIGAYANLREPGDLACQFLRLFARTAFGREVLA